MLSIEKQTVQMLTNKSVIMEKGIDNKMVEKDLEMIIPLDYGLCVQYDGDDNNVLCTTIQKYAVGEMMCELQE